jgi:hypothetical protein
MFVVPIISGRRPRPYHCASNKNDCHDASNVASVAFGGSLALAQLRITSIVLVKNFSLAAASSAQG